MTKGSDVLAMLRPDGGWIMRDNDFEQVEWVNCEPLTKEEFDVGFATYDSWKAEQDAAKAEAKAALLARLGITEEEAQLLLGGN